MLSGRGPMKTKPDCSTRSAKVGVLGQESIAGMDRLGIGHLGRGDDGRHVQIALGRRGGADTHRLVGELDVLGIPIGLGMHGHGLDAHLAAGTLDPEGDLAAVGNQDLLKHGGY